MPALRQLPLLFALPLLAAMNSSLVAERTPTEKDILYSQAAQQHLTMDFYAPHSPGPHPAVILVHSGGFVNGDSASPSETYCADFLTPAGYAVFSINYRLAPKFSFPDPVHDVERAVRFVRANARRWNIDPTRIAIVGGSAGGYLGAMAGLEQSPGDPNATDPIDRESAEVQAIVSLYGLPSVEKIELSKNEHLLLDPLIRQKGEAEARREASPSHLANKNSPPVLQIIGDKDEYFPLHTVVELDQALQAAGISSKLIVIPGGMHGTYEWYKLPNVPDWERTMTEWLNTNLHRTGPVGEGIRKREPSN